jgi:hypothetical protein
MALTNPYIIALRAGKINTVEALRNPQTTLTYSNSTINLNQFLTERGYTGNDFVPNSVLKRPTEKSEARQAAEEITAQMITVTNNSRQLPQSDAQQGGGFRNNQVRNNIVNPSSLYPTQPTVTNGQGQNSTMNYGLSTDSNYNTATTMNDFMSANPSSDINIGSANPQSTVWWKSAAPQDNSVKTSDLGGDIQHQETDDYTNVNDLPFQNQVPSDTNWASPLPSIGTTGIVLGGIAALLLLGKKR